ncbi:hypothetical protein OJ253_293 [Cryptosporidium canis]|uniref:Uncharacterized protein n=1 Tax=Cryptosporidium canis TaxID=195482 RepID=A0A9D5DQR8_9CRYT|nr:hypothetical protein OJ253_293 [Cryptosporidium canis]
MTYESIKSLIIKTSEEYKHSLGSDFKLVLNEINELSDISVGSRIENNSARYFFSLLKGKGEYRVSIAVKRGILGSSELCFDSEDFENVIKISVLSHWDVSGKIRELFEYHTEISESDSTFSLRNNEFHNVNISNCEHLRDELIPSCEIISFFDILLLSLFRFAIPQLTKSCIWVENIPLRNSLIEHIASEECFDSENDTSTDSETDERAIKKATRKN